MSSPLRRSIRSSNLQELQALSYTLSYTGIFIYGEIKEIICSSKTKRKSNAVFSDVKPYGYLRTGVSEERIASISRVKGISYEQR
jgi:hypothetical protein